MIKFKHSDSCFAHYVSVNPDHTDAHLIAGPTVKVSGFCKRSEKDDAVRKLCDALPKLFVIQEQGSLYVNEGDLRAYFNLAFDCDHDEILHFATSYINKRLHIYAAKCFANGCQALPFMCLEVPIQCSNFIPLIA